jgi:RNA polymerase sigma-70 factor (ECF subfamily)
MSAELARRVPLGEGDQLPPDDRRLMPAAGGVGDLYDAHQARLTRFLARRIGAERAPDLLHHVFVRFLGLAPDKQARIACPEAYLMRSARNLARDEHKLALRRGLNLHVSDDAVSLTAPCQIAALEARDMLERIEWSIGKLKPITRQIFLAHRLDGYSYAEIAERTGLSVKGVEKHMSRAIAHIDRTLAGR